MNDSKTKIEIFFLIVAPCIGVIIYLHDTFASTKRVEAIENQIEFIQQVVCAIAIDQNVSDVKQICTRKMR